MAQPHMQAAAAQSPQAHQQQRPQQQAHAAPQKKGMTPGRVAGTLAGGAALAGLGYAGFKAMQGAGEQTNRIYDHMQQARGNMSSPLPPMTVTASYDEFCEEKLANTPYTPVYPTMQNALAGSMAQQIASKFVGEPLDAVHKALKKKLYDDPKQEQAYLEAVSGDEMLMDAYKQNPRALQETFSTLKSFAPSIAKNPQATKSFLRQATMSGAHGSGPDFATIRLLAETEKFIQNSKGRGSNS
jgi:hypothetical protein